MEYLFEGFIYITTNKLNGKSYIGKKTFDKKCLWKEYLGSGINIKRAIKKYGKESFDRRIIAYAFSDEELNNLEKYYITKFKATEDGNFYNIAGGGDGGYTLKWASEEVKLKRNKKVGQSNKGRKIPQEVIDKIIQTKIKNGTLKGNLTEDGRRRLSEYAKNRVITKEMKEKQVETRRRNGNINLTEEAKNKISIANKGSNNGMFGKKGKLHHNYGKKASYETRMKISKNHARVDGEYAPNKRAVVKIDMNDNFIESFVTAKLAAESVGGSNSKIVAVCKGKRKTHKKYKWMYYEEYFDGKVNKEHQSNIDYLEKEKNRLIGEGN